jgi:hypothetical protein
VTLYHLDRGANVLHRPNPDRDSAATTIERMAARLLTAVSHPKAAACVKGRFFDRIDAKLNQLARFDSNELVPIHLRAMAAATISGTKRDRVRSDLRAVTESLVRGDASRGAASAVCDFRFGSKSTHRRR